MAEKNDLLALYIKKRFGDVPQDDLTLAKALADQVGLDLTLGHLVIIPRKDRGGNKKYNTYVTRDGLLHLMHKMGKPWSLKVAEPEVKPNPFTKDGKEDVWQAVTVTVYDPETGQNQEYSLGVWLSEYNSNAGAWKTHPGAMLTKVAEVHAYRRATNTPITPVEEIDRLLVLEGSEAPSEPSGPTRRGEKASKKSQGGSEKLTDKALKQVNAALAALGFTKDTSDKARLFVAKVLGIKKPLKTVADLTPDQAEAFIKKFKGTITKMKKEAEAMLGEAPDQEQKSEPAQALQREPAKKNENLEEAFPPPEVFE